MKKNKVSEGGRRVKQSDEEKRNTIKEGMESETKREKKRERER